MGVEAVVGALVAAGATYYSAQQQKKQAAEVRKDRRKDQERLESDLRRREAQDRAKATDAVGRARQAALAAQSAPSRSTLLTGPLGITNQPALAGNTLLGG